MAMQFSFQLHYENVHLLDLFHKLYTLPREKNNDKLIDCLMLSAQRQISL
jgi:hypothetical protein